MPAPQDTPPAAATGPADRTPVAAATVPLDQVMLAMDVVDTLRHQQDLVEAELDEDRRRRELVARVQAIYDAQGIEVPADVITDGVRALREDRFTYRPPERTFAVRLAELYVERAAWARRALVVALVAAALWAAVAVPVHFHHQGLIDGFRRQIARAVQAASELVQEADRLDAEWPSPAAADDPATAAGLLADARTALQRGRQRAEQVQAALTPPPDGAHYPAERARWDAQFAHQDAELAAASADLGTARGLLAGARQLRSAAARLAASLGRLAGLQLSATEQAEVDRLQRDVRAAVGRGDAKAVATGIAALDGRIDQILQARQQATQTRATLARLASALDGVDVEPEATAELAGRRAAVEQAIAAGDLQRAEAQLALLRALVEQLDRSYELRIVSGQRDRSGVWRESVDHPGARNYYLIVEAIGPDGRPVPLPITSEEDQTTRTVLRFGIRVPAEVYEAVRTDKLDNGIVDRNRFGTKRRGALRPRYDFAVAGGMITEW